MATNRFTRGSTAQIAAAIAAGTLLEGTPVYDETLGQISVARSATPNTPATYLDSQPNAAVVTPVESGRAMIDYGDLMPGLSLPVPQRYELLQRPAGWPLPALGGTFIEPWQFELTLMPWMQDRDVGAGQGYVQVMWFGLASASNPLRINFLNNAYGQSISVDAGAVVEDETGGTGSYRWRRTRQVLLSEISPAGYKNISTLHLQISAPSGGVEIFNLALLIGRRR